MSIGKLRLDVRHLTLVSLGILTLAIWLQVPVSHEKCLSAVFLDVGQGDSIFVRTPSGKTVLVDGGGSGNPRTNAVIARTVESFLRHEGVNRIDVLVLTHPHEDHVGGLAAVVRDFRIGMVLDPCIPCDCDSHTAFLLAVRAKRIGHARVLRGQRIDFGDGVQACVLNPPQELLPAENDNDRLNNNSTVIRFSYGASRLLLTGDAGNPAEESMLSSGGSLRSDTIKIGHHGSDSATGEKWLDAVRPKTAVISVGSNNDYGHPSERVLRRLSARGVRVYRTDRDGAVMVRLYPDRSTTSTFAKRRLAARGSPGLVSVRK